MSNGPRTEAGKKQSRKNAIKHGVLCNALLIKDGLAAEDATEFEQLLNALDADLEPVGALEEILVEKIAVCFWRQKRALRAEAGLVRRAFVPNDTFEDMTEILSTNSARNLIKDHLYLPEGRPLESILRYETTIHRQLVHAIGQLERMQRARRGEHVPAPLSVQLTEG
jgi:hypothetical protein